MELLAEHWIVVAGLVFVFGLVTGLIAKAKGASFLPFFVFGAALFIAALPYVVFVLKTDEDAEDRLPLLPTLGAVAAISGAVLGGYYWWWSQNHYDSSFDEVRLTQINNAEDWTLTNASNAIDGEKFEATKQFVDGARKSRIDVSLVCVPKTSDLSIKISSYADPVGTGNFVGDPFVTEVDGNLVSRLLGRVKMGDAEASSLSETFALENYENVISWNVSRSATREALGKVVLADCRKQYPDDEDIAKRCALAASMIGVSEALQSEARSTSDPGTFLAARLPLVVEVHNSGGAQQVTISRESGVVTEVIEKCSSRSPVPSTTAVVTPQETTAGNGEATEKEPEIASFADDHSFANYPIEVYQGPVAYPDFQNNAKDFSEYRTRITNAVRDGVNFAGSLTIVEIGCGTGCRMVYAVDLKTGNVYQPPLGGEETMYLWLTYQPDSTLLQAQWSGESWEKPSCIRAFYRWTGSAFALLQKREAEGKCP